MKYLGALEIQIFNRNTGKYERLTGLPPDPAIAREMANGAPWRICKCDRPLKPEMKNHYKEYWKVAAYGRKVDYEGRT